MNRKPVVFLSSTYFDLKKERSYAIRHIIKNHYIFSGMEAFFMIPMMEQWENIKRTVKDKKGIKTDLFAIIDNLVYLGMRNVSDKIIGGQRSERPI